MRCWVWDSKRHYVIRRNKSCVWDGPSMLPYELPARFWGFYQRVSYLQIIDSGYRSSIRDWLNHCVTLFTVLFIKARKSLLFIRHDSRFVSTWTTSCFYHLNKISDKWWPRRILVATHSDIGAFFLKWNQCMVTILWHFSGRSSL